MSLCSSSHVRDEKEPATRLSTVSFPTSLAAFKRTSNSRDRSSRATSDDKRYPLTENKTTMTKTSRPTLPPLHKPKAANDATRRASRSSRRSASSGLAATAPPLTAAAAAAGDASASSLRRSGQLGRPAGRASQGGSRRPTHDTNDTRQNSQRAASSPSRQHATPSSRRPKPLATAVHTDGTVASRTRAYASSPAVSPRPPGFSRPSSGHVRRTGLSEEVAAFRIQRAVRQWLLYPDQRIVVEGLARRVRARQLVETKLEAIRVRAAKRTLASFFAGLSDLNAQRIDRLRQEVNNKAAEVVSAFLHARRSGRVWAVRRRRLEKSAVVCIERAWRQSQRYATVTALSQDVKAQRLLLRHETLERRELMRQHLAYLVLRHQQAYNDPRMLDAGLAVRHVPLAASSVLLGSADETDDRLAILTGRAFHDATARTLRLCERRTFFSAQEAQMLLEENLLEVAPASYEKPPQCADIFSFDTFIHAEYAAMLRQQERLVTGLESSVLDHSFTQGNGERCREGLTMDALRLVDGSDDRAGCPDRRETPPVNDGHRAVLRHDACALAVVAAGHGMLVSQPPLCGSWSSAYRAILSGVTPSSASIPGDAAAEVTFANVRAAVNGVQNIALAAPGQNTLLVHPNFRSLSLFASLVHTSGGGCTAPQCHGLSRTAHRCMTEGPSTLRLGPLSDATTSRFLSPRVEAGNGDAGSADGDTKNDAAVVASGVVGRTADVTPFLTSPHALGEEWRDWLREGARVFSTAAPPKTDRPPSSSPPSARVAPDTDRCSHRERFQCILPLSPPDNSTGADSTAALLSDFLPTGVVLNPDAQLAAPFAPVADRSTRIGTASRTLLYNMERLLIQEHRHRQQLHSTWEAQWRSTVLLRDLHVQ